VNEKTKVKQKELTKAELVAKIEKLEADLVLYTDIVVELEEKVQTLQQIVHESFNPYNNASAAHLRARKVRAVVDETKKRSRIDITIKQR